MCALAVEERAASRAGARVARVGPAASLPLPDGPIVGFGLAGALVDDVAPGTLLTANRIVAEDGRVLWQGDPLLVPEAEPAVLCSAGRVVDDPGVRAALAARTGAIAVDLESFALAASGRLVGVVRAVSDAPARPVGRLAYAAKPDGRVAWGSVVAAFAREPRTAIRTARGARVGLAALEPAAAHLAASGGAREEPLVGG